MTTKRIVFDMDKELYQKIKDFAIEDRRTVNNVLRILIEEMIDILIAEKRKSATSNAIVPIKKEQPEQPKEVIYDSTLKQYLMNKHRFKHLFQEHKDQLIRLHKGLIERDRVGHVELHYLAIHEGDFSHRDLSNIDFTYSYFERADFTGANLTNCDFTFANLKGADFTGANLTNAKFTKIGTMRGKKPNFTNTILEKVGLK